MDASWCKNHKLKKKKTGIETSLQIIGEELQVTLKAL